jgi:anti-sigma factor RsiW
MNECAENEIQEMLPDLLHGTLAADVRGRVEAHLASCEQCREDFEVLRAVKSAAVFAPVIDIDRVVRQIPPYRAIVPAIERPAATRVVSWLVAASLVIAVVGGGSLVLARRDVPIAPPAGVTTVPPGSTPRQTITHPIATPPQNVVASAAPHTHALALATDVEGLSDGSLQQLMSDMAQFDALPAAEPDPVMPVDSGVSFEQDAR